MARAIILAAGKGSRMKSELPKVLHPFNGRPMIERVLDVARAACGDVTVVVGHKAELVISKLPGGTHWVVQKEQRGTGHAVMCAAEELAGSVRGSVVVMSGDHPLVSAETVSNLVSIREADSCVMALATAKVPDFGGENAHFSHHGRIIRSEDGSVAGIVEVKDATAEQAAVTEVNLSLYCFDAAWLWDNVRRLGADNAAHEYYLTDLVAAAVSQGKRVPAMPISNLVEGFGVNSPEELALAEGCVERVGG